MQLLVKIVSPIRLQINKDEFQQSRFHFRYGIFICLLNRSWTDETIFLK